MMSAARRTAYIFLCCVPFLLVVVVGLRPLRISGVYQSVGAILFLAIAVSAWSLVARALRSRTTRVVRPILAGLFLIMPWLMFSLFWVGLGPPWIATAAENQMRYAVLLFNSVAITLGFLLLKDSLTEAAEKLYATIAYPLAILSGAAYLYWNSYQLGVHVEIVKRHAVQPELAAVANVLDTLLFAACALTYAATAAFAASLGKAGWLGRGASRAYVLMNVVALLLISLRGFSFPDPNQGSEPWYLSPGFIAGIPAVPWIMPFLLGVVLLRRSDNFSLVAEQPNSVPAANEARSASLPSSHS